MQLTILFGEVVWHNMHGNRVNAHHWQVSRWGLQMAPPQQSVLLSRHIACRFSKKNATKKRRKKIQTNKRLKVYLKPEM